MKTNCKAIILLMLLLTGLSALTSCRKDERLDLAGISAPHIGLSISDAPNDSPALVSLSATYDETGKIVVDGNISRVYTVELESPTLEEVSFDIEPIISNIPTDKVTLSGQHIVIPAGQRSASVSVELKDEDFTFAEEAAERPAKVYELGVRLTNIHGNLSGLSNTEAKVLIKKEAYRACVRLVPTDKTTFEFVRVNNTILQFDDFKCSFRAQLDRPANADVTVDIVSSGLDQESMSSVNITPSQLIIRAGSTVSEGTAEWSMDNSILTNRPDLPQYDILLTPKTTSEDEFVGVGEVPGMGASVLTVRMNMLRTISNLDEVVGRHIDRSAFTTDIEFGEEIFFDGSTTTAWRIPDKAGSSVTVDLGREYDISALRLGSKNALSLTKISTNIAISKDGKTFQEIGRMDNTNSAVFGNDYRFALFYYGVRAKYLRLTFSATEDFLKISEIDIYEGDNGASVSLFSENNNVLTGNITHASAQSTSDVNFNFYVRTNLAKAEGYNVNVSIANELVETYNLEHGTAYSTIEISDVIITPRSLSIPANKYRSQTQVNLKLQNSSLSKYKNPEGYLVPIKVTSENSDVESKSAVLWLIIQSQENILVKNPSVEKNADESLLRDRTGWIATGEDGSDYSQKMFDQEKNKIDDQLKSIIINMGSPKSFKTICFSIPNPFNEPNKIKKIRISQSEDGENFKIIGEGDDKYLNTLNYEYGELLMYTIAQFERVIYTQYIKLEAIETGKSFEGFTEFYIIQE